MKSYLAVPIFALATLLLFLAVRLAMPAGAAPLETNALAPTSMQVPAPAPAPPTTDVAEPAAPSAEVPRLDALHQYVIACVLSRPKAWADRKEPETDRTARLTLLANEISDAIEASDLPRDRWAPYAVTLVFIAWRETVLAHDFRLVGNEDQGLAHGYLQIHEWKGMDPSSMTTGLDLLRRAPGAWCLPSPRPWEGLPKAAAYLRTHPFEQ